MRFELGDFRFAIRKLQIANRKSLILNRIPLGSILADPAVGFFQCFDDIVHLSIALETNENDSGFFLEEHGGDGGDGELALAEGIDDVVGFVIGDAEFADHVIFSATTAEEMQRGRETRFNRDVAHFQGVYVEIRAGEGEGENFTLGFAWLRAESFGEGFEMGGVKFFDIVFGGGGGVGGRLRIGCGKLEGCEGEREDYEKSGAKHGISWIVVHHIRHCMLLTTAS